jgi:hypothetical protein
MRNWGQMGIYVIGAMLRYYINEIEKTTSQRVFYFFKQ